MDEPALLGARQRVIIALAGLAWLAGCAAVPGSGDATQTAVPAPPAEPPAEPAVVSPPPAPPPPAPLPPVPIPAAERAAAVRNVQNLLQDGDTAAAEELCRRILAGDSTNAQVQSYLRQLETDPQVLLGRESYAYVVKPGESVSSIARDRMRDANLFVALARYNNIKVPRLLAAGQTIRVPGKAPAPVASPPSSASPPPPPSAPPAQAAAARASPAPETPDPTAAQAAPSAEERQRRITGLLRDARTAFARQDLCRAVRLYDSVLALDANHAQARLERERSRDLVERLRKQGGKLDC